MKFKAKIKKFKDKLWSYHFIVPKKAYDHFTADGKKRVICQIDKHEAFHAGFMPDGQNNWFIMLNKEKVKKYELEIGKEVSVNMTKDTSKYGMPMPEEFEEVLLQDELGSQYFEQLTPGKKRSLIHLINIVKNSDSRITKALVILDHLKANEGQIEYKSLNQAFKDKRNII